MMKLIIMTKIRCVIRDGGTYIDVRSIFNYVKKGNDVIHLQRHTSGPTCFVRCDSLTWDHFK